MDRHEFLAGFGSLATGAAAAVGTGAFDAVRTDWNVEVTVAGDTSLPRSIR